MEIQEFLDRGWVVLSHSGRRLNRHAISIATHVPGWEELTWAWRTHYQAAYGFNELGDLMIGPMMLRQPDIARAVENTVTSQPRLAGPPFALPGQTLPGAERRLRNILEQQAESSPDPLGRGGLLWTGPDGSSIHTSQEGWRIYRPPNRAGEGPGWDLSTWEGSGEAQHGRNAPQGQG